MSFIQIENIKFSYDGNALYNDANVKIFDDEHVVLVGANGTGKSTLLKLLARRLSPDQGKIMIRDHLKIGYLDQYQDVGAHLNVGDYIYDVFKDLYHMELEMIDIYEKIAQDDSLDQNRMLQKAQNILDYLEKENFYQVTSTIGNIINGLGLSNDVLRMTFNKLSGGMKAKVILAKLLLEESDVLLLDEPTNFLDVTHIEWLTKFLNSYSKAFIVVSHDESFLRSIAKTVIELNHLKLEKYKGNFDFYLKEKEIRNQIHLKAYESQSKKIEATKDFINKNITRASTTKRAQSRRKMLEKMVKLDKPIQKKTYHFEFTFGSPTGKDVLMTQQLLIGYDEPLIDALDIHILRGDKVVLTGKNGIGKSTFIKTLMGKQQSLGGSFEWIDTVKIAYLPQISEFSNDDIAFDLVMAKYPDFERKKVFNLLATHGIDYEKALRKIHTLSGGEQTKVMLSLLKYEQANVLILDEPTNHLDISAKEALRNAVASFAGTVILVSHEKAFYEGLCDYEIELF